MNSTAWLSYFEHNQRPTPVVGRLSGLDPACRPALIHSLARFQVGEASGGRIADEVMKHDDPALDAPTRQAIRFYVREEHRHARELLGILRALGAEPLREHWSNQLFRRCRRLLGFRTKLITMAAAEVVGIVFYGIVRDRFACPELKSVMAGIARDEAHHLDFQAEWFARALSTTPRVWRAGYACFLALELALILCAAITTVLFDHRRVLAFARISARTFVVRCLHEASSRRHLVTRTRPANRERLRLVEPPAA